ncbi:hypothetical protein [Gilliamella sp. CG22]|uniref:hypothetical protein n=1 Tax=Gilliamella sp. CG22 TaxID=3351504 RepID=UPI00398665DE
MKVRELDNNHDWTFGQGLANYLHQSDAIAQCVKTKLLSLKKDWFLDRNDGIAWFDYLAKNPNTKQLEIDIKKQIFNIEGVISIDEFDILLDSEMREFLIQITYTDKFNNSNEASFNVTDNR